MTPTAPILPPAQRHNPLAHVAGLHRVLGIDPGHEQSAYVIYDLDAGKPVDFGKLPNYELLQIIAYGHGPVVIEQIANMGMAVGAEVFETVFWSGRFAQVCESETGWEFHRVKRHEVKMALCGNMRAKDGNIRQALLDRFGPGRELAIGTKKRPGPLLGVHSDIWSALAVAVTWCDQFAAAEVTA